MNKKQLQERHRILQLLKRLPVKYRHEFLEILNDDCVDMISECCHNILKNTIHLSGSKLNHVKRKFLPYKSYIRVVANPKIKISKKRKILREPMIGGSILGIIASTVLPIIASAISSAVS